MDINELRKIKKEEMRKQELEYINTVMEDLKELEPTNVKLSESHFKEFFLPYLDGSIEVNKESIAAFRHNFLQLTNSYFVGISVVDDNTGEELFVLPPLMCEMKESEFTKYLNYNLLVNEYNQIKDVLKEKADAILEARLRELEKILNPDDSKEKEYMENILKIYKRYDLLKNKEYDEEEDLVSDDDLEIEY